MLSSLHTYAYHQITSLPHQFGYLGADQGTIISASGNVAAFEDAHDFQNDIYVVGTDGTGQHHMVDSYRVLCGCAADVDISADGSRVVSTDSVQLRIADVDGSGGQPVIAFDSGVILHPRITADGSQIFFELYADTYIRGTQTPEQAGLYVINPDSTGLNRIVGLDDIARVTGIPRHPFDHFGLLGSTMAISSTGAIVFGTGLNNAPENTQQRVFGVQANGLDLHEMTLPPRVGVWAVGISGDGSTVSYHIITPPCCSSPGEVGVENFDGTGQRMLAHQPRAGHPEDQYYPNGWVGSGDRIPLSYDGSQLLLGATGVRIDTTTGELLQLAAVGGWFSEDATLRQLVWDRMYFASMDASGTRFLYVFGDARGVLQLATLDLDPSDLGSAPLIVDATYPDHLVRGAAPATITATVLYNPSTPPIRVSNTFLVNGIDDFYDVLGGRGVDHNVMCGRVFCDPDETGVFSSPLYANPSVRLGPHMVRIKAWVQDPAGRQHATAMDFAPLEVVDSSAPRGGRKSPLEASAAGLLLMAGSAPATPARYASSTVTPTLFQTPGIAQRGQEDWAALAAGPLLSLRKLGGEMTDAVWTALRHEDCAAMVDPSAWAVLDLALAGGLDDVRLPGS